MNYQALQEAIATAIKTNGEGEITGAVLQSVLQSMVSIVGANYQYMGVATTSTNPGTPAGSVFYLTSTAGTYTNFSGIVVEDGKLTALMWNSTAWSKSEIADLSSSASDVSYDNTTSGLTASNVQEAIDELSEGGGNVDYDVISGSNVQLKNEEATPIYPKTKVEMVEGLDDLLYNVDSKDYTLSWTDGKLLRSNGSITDIPSRPCSLTDLINVQGRPTVTLKYGTNNSTLLHFYSSPTAGIAGTYQSLTGSGNIEIQVPPNAIYMRIGVDCTNNTNRDANKAYIELSSSVVETKIGVKQHTSSQPLIGAMKYAMPTDFDYAQLLFFGQSFAQGGSSKVITTGQVPNCYMYGETVKTFASGKTLNPLQLSTTSNEPYEYPVATCANALSQMYRRYGMDINIIASTGGASGASIQTLLDNYISNQQSMNQNIKTACDALGKSVGCFAIVYMQGESDYGGREDSTPDKDAYKAKLLTMKNTLQGLATTYFGQSRKPLFFIYQTSGTWVKDYEGIDNQEMGVSMAQLEFAEENDDVILISPAYQVTTYSDNHPSSNGYRWLGEYYAKAIWQTLWRGWRYGNMKAEKFVREDKRIIVYVSSCILPLQLNTKILPQQLDYGFYVNADGSQVIINSVEIEGNAIIINLASSIADAQSVYMTYGGTEHAGMGHGRGNVCDSDSWGTWTQYASDAGDTGYDGTRTIAQSPSPSIVGEDYPMNNFLSVFYHEF